ncbi:hypothetical protein ACPPVT_03195 [Angustibacter sp. McL0619]
MNRSTELGTILVFTCRSDLRRDLYAAGEPASRPAARLSQLTPGPP